MSRAQRTAIAVRCRPGTVTNSERDKAPAQRRITACCAASGARSCTSSAHSRPRLRGDRLQRESRATSLTLLSWVPAFAGTSGRVGVRQKQKLSRRGHAQPDQAFGGYVPRMRCSTKRKRSDAPLIRGLIKFRTCNGPGSAAHRFASLHAALRPGHVKSADYAALRRRGHAQPD